MIISVINSFDLTEVKFPCSSCGACCRRVGNIVSAAVRLVSEGSVDPFIAAFASFPHAFKQDGSCVQLNELNQCSIYANRPDVCDIDTAWKLFFQNSGKYEDVKAFYRHNAQICNKLIDEDKLSVDYHVTVL